VRPFGQIQTSNNQTTVALYHLSVKPISRSAGRSATGAAAYRAGVKLVDERTGVIHDYARKRGVVSADIVLPDGAPEWALERAKLWNAAELAEKRKDSCVAREYEVALPAELNQDQRRDLALEFAKRLANEEGCAVDVCIHEPGKGGDNRNHHAHIMKTTRKVEADGLGEKLETEKAGRKRKDDLGQVRELWADLSNAALAKAGQVARIDHRTLEDQGIAVVPGIHLGPRATAIERRGGVSLKTERYKANQLEAQKIINTKLTAAQEQQNGLRNAAFARLGKNVTAAERSSRAVGHACKFAVTDHEGIAENIGSASANLGRALEGAGRRQHDGHVGAVAQALGAQLARVVPAIAATAHQVVHQVELEKKARQKPSVSPRSSYHPDNLAKREAQAPATHKPVSSAEVVAAALKARKPLPVPAKPIQPTSFPVPPAPVQSIVDLVKASFAKFVEWISGKRGTLIQIDTKRGQYYGPVVQLDDFHAVQKTGSSEFAVHQLGNLDKVPTRDDSTMEIKYRDGRGTVTGKEAGKEIRR